jgi:hypothetical protein
MYPSSSDVYALSQFLLHMWSDNKVRELIKVKVLHTLLLNITVVAFKVLPLGAVH